MRTELIDSQAKYWLKAGTQEIEISSMLGKEFSFEYTGEINCIKCGRHTNKSFSQGFCYPCFTTAPETEECVLKPELCRAHEGIARDMHYAEEHCLQDQYVYLAVSSSIKVGVTRHTQVPTRWIDQGASFALPIAKTPNRHTAGLIEVALKPVFGDKTNWRKMLANDINTTIDLYSQREIAFQKLGSTFSDYLLKDEQYIEINYPNTHFPAKVSTINFDKTTAFKGILTAIKGQYLLFNNVALNIRKFGGYNLKIKIN